MLRDEDKKEIANRLAEMKNTVTLQFFTQKLAGACQFCTETERLLSEVADLSEKLEMDIKNFITDTEDVQTYDIKRIPATVIKNNKDFGIKFYGIPTGYEFASFLEAILLVSQGASNLDKSVQEKLKELEHPVHIQVFVTPTCPYCTKAALLAYQLAIESPLIQADVIEVTEFPQLTQKYSVMGVPKIVLNEDISFEGAVPENIFVDHVMQTAQSKKSNP